MPARAHQVKEAHIVYGLYDIVALIEAETMQELKDTINMSMRVRARNKPPFNRVALSLETVEILLSDIQELQSITSEGYQLAQEEDEAKEW